MADKPKRRTNAVYLNGGPISQIKNFPFKKVYHGTRIPLEIDDEGNAIIDGPFFVTPYQSIACIFVARRNTEETLPPETKGAIRNISYEEWSKPNNEILSKVTEYVEYMDDTHFDDIVSHEKGYLYEFDVDDYVKEHVFQSAKMTMQSKTHEYCIDHVSKLKVAKTTPLDIELTIKPRKYVDRKHRPFSESYIPDDATSGTSDFDEKDDDPEDCLCESTNINEGCDNMPLSEFDHYFQEGLFQNIFSKEKRAEKFINNGITKLLPAFIKDLDKINTAYNSMKYNRRLIMGMYYPRTVYTTQTVYDTHYGPNGSIYTIPRTVTTSHQEPTPEMVRLNSVAYFFKRITKKVHIMDMVNCPDTVYGALNASGNMYKEIYVVFGSKNVNDALAKLYATTLELSNHINAFIGVLSNKSDAANLCDAIDVNAVDPDLPDIELPPLEENDSDLIQESMSAKERNALKNSDFAYIKRDSNGKVVERKYPINNEEHVKSAAHLFPRGIPDDPKIRKKVANKILRKAHSYGMDTSGWTSLNKAAGKTVKEGYEETIVEDLYQESASKSFRAQYKDPAYFEKFINNEEESIKRFKGAGKEDKNSIIAGKYLKLISAKYSNGESKKAIKADVDSMFKYVKDVSSYNDMVDYLSLAILFDIDRKKIYNVMKCDKYDDVFITGLKKYVDKKDHSVTYAGLKYPKQYETFNKALNGEINGEELDKYINSRWYPSCKGRAFYDDHKSKADTYCGYWCWVGGAVAKIKSMNKDMSSKYTPTDLI